MSGDGPKAGVSGSSSSDILLTFVTICFRNPADLRRTLECYAGIDLSITEVVVIDGSPDDSCAKVAAEFPQFRYLQGRDTGKYNAMNKGAAVARGRAVLYINSGDQLVNPASLMDLLHQKRAKLQTTMIYGDHVFAVGGRRFHVTAQDIDLERIDSRLFPSHQATIIPAEYQRRHPYDETMTFVADYKFLERAFSEIMYEREEIVIAEFKYGGVSTSPGSLKDMVVQFHELQQCEGFPLNRLRTAIMLVKRKLVHLIIGDDGLQSIQANQLVKRELRELPGLRVK